MGNLPVTRSYKHDRLTDRSSVYQCSKLLTSKERNIIRTTWKLIAEQKLDHGIYFFHKLIENCDTIKRFFTSFNLSPNLEELQANVKFKNHALKFMQSIDFVIDANFDRIICQVRFNELRKKHLRYPINEDYIQAFADAFCYVLQKALGKGYNLQVELAWRALFIVILDFFVVELITMLPKAYDL